MEPDRPLDSILTRLQAMEARFELVLKGLNDTIGSDRDAFNARIDEIRRACEAMLAQSREISGGPSSAVQLGQSAMLERITGWLESTRHNLQGSAALDPPNQPSPFQPGGRWELVGGAAGTGSWENGYKIRGLASFNGELFVTVTGKGTIGGTIWALRDGTWRCVASPETQPELAPMGTNALLPYQGSLYAAVGLGGLWRLESDQFARFDNTNEPLRAYSLAEHDGQMFLGCGLPAVLYRVDGRSLVPIAGNGEFESWDQDAGYGSVYSMLSHGGALYAALARPGYGPISSGVWRFDGSRWQQVGGDAIRRSWVHPHICYILDLVEYREQLIAAMTRPRTLPGDVSSVMAFDGDQWKPVGHHLIPYRMGQSHIFNHMIVWRDRLYVATGDTGRKIAAVWELTDDAKGWRMVGGGDDFPAWETSLTQFRAEAARAGGQWIYRMHVHDDALYVGLAGYFGGAQLWRFTPQTTRS